MRHIVEPTNREKCQSYKCSECGWRYDVRRFSFASIEFWFAERNFESARLLDVQSKPKLTHPIPDARTWDT
jgi:hypothetical protein